MREKEYGVITSFVVALPGFGAGMFNCSYKGERITYRHLVVV